MAHDVKDLWLVQVRKDLGVSEDVGIVGVSSP